MSDDKCHCPPFIDGGVLVRRDCTHHVKQDPAPAPVAERDPELDEIACAWSDYRSAYGATTWDHKAFAAGWRAARGAVLNGVLR